MGRNRETEIIEELDIFFKGVNEENFNDLFEDFKILVTNYRDSFSKNEILKILFEYNQNNTLTEYQEEILTEIENRIFGYCSPAQNINWEDPENNALQSLRSF